MKIKIEELDLSLQTRAGTDAETIDNYAEAMADGAQFPEVTVFTDGAHYWLADGFHRVMAAKQNGRTVIAADVRKGTEDDAVVFGGTANNKQGKRPTRADVQHFLQMVWDRREAIFGGTPTGGNLAEKCGVSHTTGERFVRERLAEMPNEPMIATRKKCELKMPERGVSEGGSTANVGQLPSMPTRPTQLIGANGKMYPVLPSMPTRPSRPAHVVPVDRYGTEIPVEINDAFDGGVLADVCGLISKARVALRKGFEDKLPQFAAVRQDALVQLDNAYRFVSAAEPHCVCRMCQGTGCKACHERGWQTEEEYRRNPNEFQAEEVR